MKKNIAILVGALLVSGTIFAAGNSQGGKREKLEVWDHPGEGEIADRYFEKFSELYPEFDYEYVDIGGEDLKQQLRLAVESGTAPDLLYINSGTMYQDFQKAGALGDLTDIIKRNNLMERINPDYIKPYTTDGKPYAFPVAPVTTWGALYINRDLFNRAGITKDPATISELINVSSKLRAAGIEPLACGLGSFPVLLFMGDFYAQQKKNLATINQINSGKLKFTNTPEIRKALEVIVALHKNNVFMTGSLSSNGNDEFAAGKVAMLYLGSWWPSGVGGISNLGFVVDVISMPLIDEIKDAQSVQMGSDMAYAINAKSINKKSVEKFLEYATREEATIIYAESINGFSIYPGANTKVNSDPLFKKPAIQNQFSKSSWSPLFDWVFPTPVTEMLKVVIQQLCTDQLTVDQALDQLQAEADRNIGAMSSFPE
jgi:ABC-type glycerol-3-phosphate transport system substrate-binding protein